MGDLLGRSKSACEWKGDDTSPMRFAKWQALGNDYIVLEADDVPVRSDARRGSGRSASRTSAATPTASCCCRGPPIPPRTSPTCASSTRTAPRPSSPATASARPSCTSGRPAGPTDDTFTILTAAGEITPTLTGPDSASVDMGRAATTSPDFPDGPEDGRGTIDVGGVEREFQHVSIGNPQCAIEVTDGLEELDLPAIGPAIEAAAIFPNRSNVSFWRAEGSRVRARIFERGVGETLSSGTGATGAAVAAHLRGRAKPDRRRARRRRARGRDRPRSRAFGSPGRPSRSSPEPSRRPSSPALRAL